MKRTVRQLGELCGITPRTLRYYHQIGLLAPAELSPAGYRLYGDAQLERLQQILFFRELGFSLEEIAAILDNPRFDRKEALGRHRELLLLRRNRLDGLISLTERAMKGEHIVELEPFSMNEIEKTRRQYAQEARERWGGTDAYAQSKARTDRYTPEDWAAITAEAEGIFAAFAAAMEEGPRSAAARKAVAGWQEHITRRYYPCTREILAGLGEMYAADDRFTKNIDKHRPGLARFMSEAIARYCERGAP